MIVLTDEQAIVVHRLLTCILLNDLPTSRGRRCSDMAVSRESPNPLSF